MKNNVVKAIVGLVVVLAIVLGIWYAVGRPPAEEPVAGVPEEEVPVDEEVVPVGEEVVEEPVEEEPVITEIGTGDLHVSFWNGLTGSDGVTLNEMLAQFAQDNPDISITVEIIAWDTLYMKLQTAFVAGTQPDMFLAHASGVPMFAEFGVLRDLGDQFTSGGGWLADDDISETTMYGLIWDGVKYAIPLDNHGRGLWINTDMFEAAGISTDPATAPTTFEGWVELFQKLTIDVNGNNALSPDFDPANVAQWGFAVGEWPNVNFMAALAQHGGSFLSEDGTTVTINSEAGIKALQQVIDLVYEYNVSPPAAGFDSWASFGGGTLAVIPTGTWFRNWAALQEGINSMAWPNWQQGPAPSTWFGTHAFMIPAATEGEDLEAVTRVIQWVTENQAWWATSGQVPALMSVQETLSAEEFPSNILLGQTFTEYGVQDPRSPIVREMLTHLGVALSEALNDMKTAEQALNDAAVLMQQALDRQ